MLGALENVVEAAVLEQPVGEARAPSSVISTNQSISKVERGNASSRVMTNITARNTATVRVTARVMLKIGERGVAPDALVEPREQNTQAAINVKPTM